MHMTLGTSLWHDLNISGQLSCRHVHHVAGSNGVKVFLQDFGWLTHEQPPPMLE